MKRDLSSICESILMRRGTWEDILAMLDPASRKQETPRFRIVWAAQHIFKANAKCVGDTIIHKNGLSPLVEQLELLGYKSNEKDLTGLRDRFRKGDRKIDALLIPKRYSDTVTLVQGITYSGLLTAGKQGAVHIDQMRLYQAKTPILPGMKAPVKSLRGLTLARDVIKRKFPELQVKAYFVVVSDPDCLWNYRATDLTDLKTLSRKQSHIRLDDLGETQDSRNISSEAMERFDLLPDVSFGDWMSSLPMSRPSRALLQLNELFKQQRGRSDLSMLPAFEIEQRVSEKNKLYYPVNQRRHDREDCAERRNLILRDWSGDRGTVFAVSPSGIGRMMLLKHLFNPLINNTSECVLRDEILQMDLIRSHFGI